MSGEILKKLKLCHTKTKYTKLWLHDHITIYQDYLKERSDNIRNLFFQNESRFEETWSSQIC